VGGPKGRRAEAWLGGSAPCNGDERDGLSVDSLGRGASACWAHRTTVALSIAVMKVLPDQQRHVVGRLLANFADVEASPSLPKVLVINGETGRGKTYCVQRFFDELRVARPGYWGAPLTPRWPPIFEEDVHRERKQVVPREVDEREAPPFLWVGAGAAPMSGAIRVEMASTILDQLLAQFQAVAPSRRRTAATREAIDIALDVLGTFVTPFGIAKTSLQHTAKVGALVGTDVDRLVARRAALHDAYRVACRAASPGPVPLVVALDDASRMTVESLDLLSGLLAPSALDTTPQRLVSETGKTAFFPASLTSAMAGPLLVVATVWQHRSQGRFQDPFFDWLDELESIGIPVERASCTEFAQPVAELALSESGIDLDEATRERVVVHISSGHKGVMAVNPLVLTGALGRLNELRKLWGDKLEVDDATLGTFATVPEQHVKDRLESLRRDGDTGSTSVALVTVLAHAGAWLPLKLVELVGERICGEDSLSAAQLVSDHVLWTHDTWPSDLTTLAERQVAELDVDVQTFLAASPLPEPSANALASAAGEFIAWALSTGLVDNGAAYTSENEFGALRPAARWAVRVGNEAVASDVLLACHALLGEEVQQSERQGLPAVGYAYSVGAGVELSDLQFLEVLKHFGDSTVTERVAARRLRQGAFESRECEEAMLAALSRHRHLVPKLARALIERKRYDEALAALAAHSDLRSEELLQLAECYVALDNIDTAIEVLGPVAAGGSSNAAVRLARLLLQRGRRQEAVTVLLPFPDRSDPLVLLADIYDADGRPDLALSSLESGSDRNQDVTVRMGRMLAKLGRDDEALQLLDGQRVRPDVAMLLADIHLKHRQPDRAIEALREAAVRSESAAAKLASLLRTQGRAAEALEVLSGLATRRQEAPLRMADILCDEGEVDQAIDLLLMYGHSAQAACYAANLLQRRRRYDEAIRVLEPHAKTSQEGPLQLAQLHLDLGHTDRALRVLEGSAPRWHQSAVRLAQLLLLSGEAQEALLVLDPHLGTKPEATMLACDILNELGDVEAEIGVLRRTAPRYVDSSRRLAGILRQQGHLDEAIGVLQPHATSQGAPAPLAELLCAAGRAAEAINTLRIGVRNFPTWQWPMAGAVLSCVGALPTDEGEYDVTRVIAEVWQADRPRTASRLEQVLWYHIANPDGSHINGEPHRVMSILEVVHVLRPEPDPRLDAVVTRWLEDETQGSFATYQAVHGLRPHSAIARQVIDAIVVPAPDLV
jgi:tetratricopeptide (TPR) repeat protein